MPPALSDIDPEDSSAGEEEIPAPKDKSAMVKVEQEEEEDDEESEPDEFVVEKIMAHKFVKGELIFDVKWQGYDKPKDRTWEPEANMVAATDVMNEYFDEIGGRPEPKAGQKRKGRASGVGVATESESGTPVASAKRTKQIKKEAIKKKPVWAPPPGSWEHEVEYIDTVEENIDAKTGLPMRFVYVLWNGGQKTQHPLKIINQKCPQKMLAYYESHLVFSNRNDRINDDDGNSVAMEDAY